MLGFTAAVVNLGYIVILIKVSSLVYVDGDRALSQYSNGNYFSKNIQPTNASYQIDLS